jgi:hypothetical protein
LYLVDDANLEERARHIVARLLTLETNQDLQLSEEHLSLIENLVRDQIKRFQITEKWHQARQWTEMIIDFYEQSMKDAGERYIDFRIMKVEALLNLKLYTEALDTARKALSKMKSTRTIVTYFKTLAHIEDISESEVVDKIAANQDLDNKQNERSTFHLEDHLKEIEKCMDYVVAQKNEDILKTRRDNLFLCLLRYWIKYFVDNHMWNVLNEPGQNSFFNMVGVYVTFYLNVLLEKSTGTIRSQHESINIGQIIDNILKTNAPASSLKFHIESAISYAVDAVKMVVENNGVLDKLGLKQELEALCNAVETTASLICTKVEAPKHDNFGLILFAGAIFQMIADFMPFLGKPPENIQRQARCLVHASAALYDASTSIPTKADRVDDLSQLSISMDNAAENDQWLELHKRIYDCSEWALKILQPQLDFNDYEDKKLFNTALTIQMASISQTGVYGQKEDFVISKRNQFILLDIESMRDCVDLVTNSRKLSTESLRNLLDIAEKICTKSSPIHKMSGLIYRKAIEVSPNRLVAFNKVESFLKLIEDPTNRNNIDNEEIENITIQTYNFGITLIDLDQLGLAEKFNNLAIQLTNYCNNRKDWIEKMEVIINSNICIHYLRSL